MFKHTIKTEKSLKTDELVLSVNFFDDEYQIENYFLKRDVKSPGFFRRDSAELACQVVVHSCLSAALIFRQRL